VAAAVLAAACAAPRHVGPVTGRAGAFSASQGGVFAGERFLCAPPFRPFALAADGRWLLLGGGEPAASGEVALLAHDGTLLARARPGRDVVYAVALAPGGASAAAGLADGRVLLFDVPALAASRERMRHSAACRAVAFGPDGALLASAGLDGKVLLADARGDQAPVALLDHTAGVECVAFDAGGDLLASGARDGKVRLHSSAGRLLRTDQKLGGAVAEVAFTGDGSVRATLADGRTVLLPGHGRR
jgi:WD40 repeat protein